MSEFRRIMMSSFLMLLLHFPAAAVRRYIVRAGDEVTLPFDYVIHDQDKCESTRWYFSDSRGSPVTLFEDGQIHNDSKAKSDRLRVTENCSLVIKKVTEEDAGYYTCRQLNRSGEQQGPDSEVLLSVVSMTEHQDNDEVTLRCSVSTDGWCLHPVKWLLQGRDVDKDHREINTSLSYCSASVTFQTSLFSNTTRSELVSCAVTNVFTGEVHLFPFSAQSSDATTTGTAIDEWTSESNTGTGADCKHPEGPAVWWVILVSVGLAALVVTVVTVHIWTRAKGGKKGMRKNLEQNDEDEDEVNYENDGGASASV
ncbi:uncharacterized protein LOC117537824 isoform X2 [Gymnodraco acuticeps]|uniref:Uncharacterized protein LOC117537824 isoform X2 n=1 Tax=Gymnodraco acuticeps TaxID=8218 RepID=A0A6P8TMC2_GYMAC|nr:uncharacterized protein LOC117537824 isoform X2 [Gymnodraco acuticeps]